MPLEGIKVLDWTVGQFGPAAAAMLGDLGADVIKIEQPVTGDSVGRTFTSPQGMVVTGLGGGRNYYFESANRSKRGIVLNLKKDEGKQILYRLVEKADVFVNNFRKRVIRRTGLDYETLSRYNPRLVYAWGTAFGPEGPDGEKAGADYSGQARSGIMTSVGEPDMDPLYHVGGFADQMGAIVMAYGIMVALVARERLGVGQEIDVSLLGSMMLAQGVDVSACTIFGREWQRYNRKAAGNPLWNHYKCADGKWIVLVMFTSDRCWPDFCRVMDLKELETDPRFQDMERRKENSKELIALLDNVFARKPRAEWMAMFDKALADGADVSYSFVNTVSDLPNDPQVLANQYITTFDHPVFGPTQVLGLPFRLSKTPGAISRGAPELGQHTEQILLELGYSRDEVRAFRDRQVI
jgi:crotonobetainyl-CoA:carnitine CoA-transferase CaiB-like acyl-CoA transferase